MQIVRQNVSIGARTLNIGLSRQMAATQMKFLSIQHFQKITQYI